MGGLTEPAGLFIAIKDEGAESPISKKEGILTDRIERGAGCGQQVRYKALNLQRPQNNLGGGGV